MAKTDTTGGDGGGPRVLYFLDAIFPVLVFWIPPLVPVNQKQVCFCTSDKSKSNGTFLFLVALLLPSCGLPRLNPGRRPAPTFELIFPARGPLLLQDPLLLLIFASQDALEEMFLNDWLTEWPFAYFTDVTLVRGDTSRTFFLFYIHMFLCLCPSSEIECFQTL